MAKGQHRDAEKRHTSTADLDRLNSLVETLRISEARYRALVNAASQAVWAINPAADTGADDGVRWWIELTGQTPAQAAGWGWLEAIHPGDRARVRELWNRSRQNGTPYEADYRVRTSDGTYRHFEVRGVAVRDADNTIREWVGMFNDITARRETEEALLRSEERFRVFMDNSPAAASILDVEGRVVYVSEGFRRMFQLPGEPIGRTVFDLFPADIAQAWLDGTSQAVLADQALEAIEPGIRADGSQGTFLTYRFPLHDSGETRLVGSVAADITEFRRLEDQLRQIQKMEAVGQLAGGVAHDFNNVLTVIQGFSELVLNNLPPGHELAQPIGEIKRAGERAAQLTGQLLAFSRKAVVRPIVLDLNAVLTDAENMLRRLIGENIELTSAHDPTLWKVTADPVQVDQLLFNLVSNARDAMPQGGSIALETRNVVLGASQATGGRLPVPPGTYVCLSVTDTGCGMEPDTMDRIFEPFFTTKAPDKGTGMGLAAVYGIVQQCGGHIRVQSQPGIGTSFSIYLPPRHEDVSERTTSADAAVLPRGKETVLLVEDDDSVRALSREILTRQGYLVLVARHGLEALRLSDSYPGPIDILVTDVVMPHIGGVQVAEQLRQTRPTIKTLFVSGYPDDALGEHGVIDVGIALLQKPFLPTTLANKVRSVLDTPNQRDSAL
jgi:two-component system, cell cycle sensor histidine kinase and response regulator CckA